MPFASNQPDLIIALSNDKVRLNLLGQPEKGRDQWGTSINIDGIFLEDQISRSLDQVLFDHPVLIDQFPSVEILVLDRPGVNIPRYYFQNATAAEIAGRYLRLRTGDTLTADDNGKESLFCYTLPTNTLRMLKEYYANISVTHLSSVLWYALSDKESDDASRSITYFIHLHDILVVLASKNNKLMFAKNFNIRQEADLFYYTIACSRLLQSEEQWFVSIENEDFSFEMPGHTIVRIDKHLSLPSLHVLLSQYKLCES